MADLRFVVVDSSAPAGSVPTADGQDNLTWQPITTALNIPLWAANTAYAASFVVQQSGALWSRNVSGTSAATWTADQTNWTQVS